VALDSSNQGELLSYMGQLPAADQARVVDFARALAGAAKPRVRGTPGKELLRIVGTIPHADLELMKQVIEQECERIDSSEW
jgi:hypothetical protein